MRRSAKARKRSAPPRLRSTCSAKNFVGLLSLNRRSATKPTNKHQAAKSPRKGTSSRRALGHPRRTTRLLARSLRSYFRREQVKRVVVACHFDLPLVTA